MRLAAAVALGLAVGAARADDAPAPPARPPSLDLRTAADEPSVEPSVVTPGDGSVPLPPARPDEVSPVDREACLAALVAAGAEAAAVPDPGEPDSGCRIEDPVRLTAVADAAGTAKAIALPGEPVVACRTATSFAAWAGRIAAPALAARRGATLSAIRTGPGFACRPRNGQEGAKPSAHGNGLAIDVTGFGFSDRSDLAVNAEAAADPAFAAVRIAACGWFLTVLGPGSDPYHADHLHLDLQRHGASDRYRICQ